MPRGEGNRTVAQRGRIQKTTGLRRNPHSITPNSLSHPQATGQDLQVQNTGEVHFSSSDIETHHPPTAPTQFYGYSPAATGEYPISGANYGGWFVRNQVPIRAPGAAVHGQRAFQKAEYGNNPIQNQEENLTDVDIVTLLSKALEESPVLLKLQKDVSEVMKALDESKKKQLESNKTSAKLIPCLAEIKSLIIAKSVGGGAMVGTRRRTLRRPSSGYDTLRVRTAKALSCKSEEPGCTSLGNVIYCTAAVLWSKCLKDRPSGIKSGTHLGSLISQHLKNVQLYANHFYPDCNLFFDVLVLPALRNAAQSVTDEAQNHVKELYKVNKQYFEECLRVSLRNIYGTRRKDIVEAFQSFNCSKRISDCFANANAVDSGLFRSNENSPVDDPRFVHSVRTAFRLQGRAVSLSMLAFGCVTLIREFTKKTVQPALFRLVPGGALSQVSHEEHREMHGLCCAALAIRLDEKAIKTDNGWKTSSFDITHIEDANTNWLSNYKVALDTTKM